MGCLNCQFTQAIPTCTTTLAIGTTTIGAGVPVYVFVRNIITGKEFRQSATTEALPAGRVSMLLSLPQQDFYSQNFVYEIWITRQSDTVNERLNFTIQGSVTAIDCVSVNFTDIYDDDDDKVAYSSHILEFEA